MEPKDEQKIYALLGLTQRAGRVASGNFQVEEAIAKRKARLVIVSIDAGENTKDLFRRKCEAQHLPLRFFGEKDSLGHAIGKELRSCTAITDAGFAGSLVKLIDNAERGQNGENENQ